MRSIELSGGPEDTAVPRSTRRRAGILPGLISGLELRATLLNLPTDAVHLATEIATLEQGITEDQRFALIVLILASLASLQAGSTRLLVRGDNGQSPLRDLIHILCSGGQGTSSPDAVSHQIETLLESDTPSIVIGRTSDDYKPLLYLRPFISLQRMTDTERKLAAKLIAIARTERRGFSESQVRAALSDVTARPISLAGRQITFSAEQEAAVLSSVLGRLAVVSGGPGTGKTSVVLAIVRVLLRLGMPLDDIALAAPTGKAAFRMQEFIQEGMEHVNPDPADDPLLKRQVKASTLHRLLDYSPTQGRFRRHRNNQLSSSFVIVDEGSMIDLVLMNHLLDALELGTHLVILGDADQLPSVAAGAVFHDLASSASEGVAPGVISVSRLNHNFRVASAGPAGAAILRLAASIRAGGPLASDSNDYSSALTLRASPSELSFEGVELVPSSAPMSPFFDAWDYYWLRRHPEIRKLMHRAYTFSESGFDASCCGCLRRLFSHFARFRILCVTRVFDTGSELINQEMHRRALRAQPRSVPADAFLIGEPVAVSRNDYDRNLFNGDQGLVLTVQSGTSTASSVIFQRANNFVAFPLDTLRDRIELSYAMTVHKAQGSEFDSISLILPRQDLPMLSREILYTAVSRARRSAAIVGDTEVLEAGIRRRSRRSSGLSEQLAAAALMP